MKQIIVFCIILASAAGCSYHDLGCTENANLFETAVTLKIALGEKVCNVSGLAVRFEKVVNDSRCPKDVNCFTEGHVEVRLVVLNNDHPIGTLNLKSNQPLAELTIMERDYAFVLKSVSPYPVIGKATPPHKYRMVVEITPKGD